MKKSTSILLLLFTCCGLVACENDKTSSPAVTSSSPAPSVSSSTSSSSSKPSSTPVSSIPVSSVEEESTSSSETSSSFDYNSSRWSKDTIDLMLLHLDGNVIPDLGQNASEMSEWAYAYASYGMIDGDYGYINIETDMDYSSDNLTAFETIYTAAGWTKVSSTVYTKGNLKVEFINDDSILYVHASITETYDASKAQTGWDTYVVDELNANLDNQANLIPYFYMGTSHNVSVPYYYSYEHTVYLLGGPWDDDALTQAANAFTQANGWENQATADSKFTASRTATNGSELSVTVSKGANGAVQLAIKYILGYDKDAYTDWDANTKQTFIDNFDGHTIPFFYIGTDAPSISGPYTSSYYGYTYAYLSGSYFHDEMLTDSKAVFDALDGWTVEEGTNYYGNTITVTHAEVDGCYFSIIIGKDYNDNARAEIRYIPKVEIPSGVTGYEDATKTAINTYLGGNAVPYFYLNLASSGTAIPESVSYDNASRTLYIYGDDWNANIITNAVKNNELADWTIKTKSIDGLTATRTYDNGDTIDLTVGNVSSYSSSHYGDACVAFTFKSAWHKSTNTATAWEDSVKTAFTNGLKTDAIPYIYLGSTTVPASFDTKSSTVTLYGNAWDSTTLGKDFAAAFAGTTTDSTTSTLTWTWAVSDTEVYDDNGDRIYMATGTDASGNRLLVQVFKDDSGFTDMKVTYLEAYNKSDLTDWTDDNKTAFTTAFGDTDKDALPFVYLGTKTPTVTANSTVTSSITIAGGAWDDQVLTDAAAVFTTEDGWTSKLGGDSNNYVFMAYKKLASGASLRVFIYSTSSDDTAHIGMDVYYDPALDSTNAANLNSSDWGSSINTKIEDYCGYDLPYFGVPSLPTSSYKSSDAYNIYTYSLSQSSNNLPYFTWALKAAEDIKVAGGESTINLLGSSSTRSISSWMLTAKLPVDKNDASKGFFRLSFTSSISSATYAYYDVYFNYYPKFDATAGSAWSTSNQKKMTALFGEVIPYVYLGTTKPTVSSSYATQSMTITGQTWDDSILTNAETAFTADAGWTTGTDDINYSTTAFTATKTTSSGNKIVVIIYDSISSAYGLSVPVMDIYLRK